MDLFRPESREAAWAIVEKYSGHEPEVLKRDFFHSLCAAFEPGEVRAQLDACGLGALARQDGVRPPPDRERPPARMTSEFTFFERLMLPLVRWLVALWVRPSVLPDDVRDRLSHGRPLVYALEKRSVVDFAVLEYVCRERNLPRPLAPLGSGTLLKRSVFYLERRVGFFGLRVDRRMPDALRILCGAAAADLAFEADIVPVSLFWGRAPGRERSWFRLMVAEGWDIGGRFRKFLSLLINGSNLVVLYGEALSAAALARGDARHGARPAPAVAPAAHAVPQPAHRDHRAGPLPSSHDRRAGAAGPRPCAKRCAAT